MDTDNFLARQGDLLIQPTGSIPKGVKKVLDNVVLEGEATGHHHRLVGGYVYKHTNGAMYFQVNKKATLVHEEHKPIEFKAGKYAVIRQREYVSSDMVRPVVD